ncbi:hypothetical protein CXB51_020245 [Gossypium anomalum]|uniref:Cytochrome P450 n=1 Tax=Gossypium anomalum TaxID=47600 RepID=A0A8J5YLY0_9ROSI|nr:hypothetical protein CXB51_020245 [Gossypium anomalum]
MDFLSCLLYFVFYLIFFQAFHFITRRKLGRTHKLPPGPPTIPIFENLFQLGDEPHRALAKLASIHGDIMTLKLGQTTMLVLSSAAMAKEILQTYDAISCNRTVPGEAIEVSIVVFKTTLNLLSNTIFSIDLADSSDSALEYQKIVQGVREELGKPNFVDYFPTLLDNLDLQGIRRRMSIHFEKLMNIFDKLIDERLELKKLDDYISTNDLLDTLLQLSEQDSNEELDRNLIKHLILDLLIAGTNSTSSTLEWAMAELFHNPKALRVARRELQQVIGEGNPVEESHVTCLPYLRAIVKETMRLHPPIPLLLPRKAEEDIEIHNFVVPKGARVLINAWAIGRDPNFWEEPDLFVPERYIRSTIDVKGRDFGLIPFGSGRRICPGLPLAMRMLHLTLGTLIYSFDWELEDGVTLKSLNMNDTCNLVLQKAQRLRVISLLSWLMYFISYVIVFQALHAITRKLGRRAKLLPSPPTIPIFENLFQLGDNPHKSLAELASVDGDIMTLKLGQITTIVFSSATMAKEILQKHDAMPVSTTWKNHRKICNLHIFASHRLDANQYLRHTKVEQLLPDVRHSFCVGKAVEIRQAAFKTTLSFTSNTIFSIDLANSFQASEEFREIVQGILEDLTKPNFVKKTTKSLTTMKHGQGYAIRVRHDTNMPKNQKAQLLKSNKFLEEPLRAYLFFISKFSTNPSTTLIFFFPRNLHMHPDSPSDSDLFYLSPSLFLLHPPVPFLIPRKAKADIEVYKFVVPKGAQVFINTWVIGRDPNFWEEPDLFRPERFIRSKVDVKGKDFGLIPFEGRRRICPGLLLAMRMLHSMLGTLIHSFD